MKGKLILQSRINFQLKAQVSGFPCESPIVGPVTPEQMLKEEMKTRYRRPDINISECIMAISR